MDASGTAALIHTLHAQILHIFCDALEALEDERVSIAEGVELSQHMVVFMLDFLRTVRPMGPAARAALVQQLRRASLTFTEEGEVLRQQMERPSSS